MYSVTKEKSNEKIQEAILYSPAPLQVRPRPARLRRAEEQGAGGIPRPYADLSLRRWARGPPPLALASCFIGTTLRLLTLILTPTTRPEWGVLCLRIRGVVQANVETEKPGPELWFYFPSPLHPTVSFCTLWPFMRGEGGSGGFLIIPNVNVLFWNEFENVFFRHIFLDTML